MRTFLLLVTGMIFVAGCAQSVDSRLDAKVSADYGCLPMSELVAKLGKQAGVSMGTDAAARDMLAILYTHDMPLRTVMSKLATTFRLSWSRSDDKEHPKYVLRQTVAQARASEEANRKAQRQQVEQIRKSIASFSDATKLPEAERDRQADEFASQQDQRWDSGKIPAGYACAMVRNADVRMVAQLLSGWKDEDWDRLLDSKGVTYSTSPNSAQFALPATYVASAKTWQADVSKLEPGKFPPPYTTGHVAGPVRVGDANPRQYDPDAIGVVNIRVTYDEKGSFRAAASVLDKNRQPLIESAGLRLNAFGAMPADVDVSACSDKPLFGTPYQPPKPLVDLGAGNQVNGISAAYDQWMSTHKKDEFLDPLDVGVSPLMRDIADKMHVSVLVEASDVLIALPLKATKGDLGAFLRSWLSWAPDAPAILRFDATDGWLVASIRPGPLMGITANSVPRSALRKLYTALYGGKLPSLDETADAVLGVGDKQLPSLGMVMYTVWGSLKAYWTDVPGEIEALRFWATLNPRQREIAQSDGLRASLLSVDQHAELTRMLISQAQDTWDWTEAIPNGVPPSAVLSVKVDQGPGFLATAVSEDETDERAALYASPISPREYRQLANSPSFRFFRGGSWEAMFMVSKPDGELQRVYLRMSRLASPKPVDKSDPDLSKLLQKDKGAEKSK